MALTARPLAERAALRLTRLLARWGLIAHPFGRDRARDRITLTGKRKKSTMTDESDSDSDRREPVGFVKNGVLQCEDCAARAVRGAVSFDGRPVLARKADLPIECENPDCGTVIEP